jgi:hypothetical protein
MQTSGPYPFSIERQTLKIKTMVYGKVNVANVPIEIRPANDLRQILTIKSLGQDRVYLAFDQISGPNMVADGFPLDMGESVIWNVGFTNLWTGPIWAMCDSNNTAELRFAEGT